MQQPGSSKTCLLSIKYRCRCLIPLIFADSCPGWDTLGVHCSMLSQFPLKFYWVQTCFGWYLEPLNTIYWSNFSLVMPKPVYLMTVQEAHQEYTSLTDKIWAKYEQLDSGEFGSPGTPAFDVEACDLANLLACVSELCKKLNLPMPKELYRNTFFKHWRHFGSKLKAGSLLGYGGCSFVPLHVRIIGLLSAL